MTPMACRNCWSSLSQYCLPRRTFRKRYSGNCWRKELACCPRPYSAHKPQQCAVPYTDCQNTMSCCTSAFQISPVSFLAKLHLESHREGILVNVVPVCYVAKLQKPAQVIPCHLYRLHLTVLNRQVQAHSPSWLSFAQLKTLALSQKEYPKSLDPSLGDFLLLRAESHSLFSSL